MKRISLAALIGALALGSGGCSIIRQSTSAEIGGTNWTARAWCVSLWEGRTVIERMRLSAGPRFVAVGVEGQQTEATATNIVPTIEAVTRLLQSIPRP